jgi:hypothetical protein
MNEQLTDDHTRGLERQLAEAKAETAAALEFLDTELGWEYFRIEMLCFDDKKKERQSEENARKLKNYLAEKGHGIALLRELKDLREKVAQLSAEREGN